MLNLDPNNAVVYTQKQQDAIDNLVNNRGDKKGKELWKYKGSGNVFEDIQRTIRRHCLTVQRVRCAYCETGLEYGGAHIEHFADKDNYTQYIYEPLNLVCSCPVCNGVAKKGRKDTIDGIAKIAYIDNNFKYVHPYLDDVIKEIKYKDPFHILIDMAHSTDKGKATIEMFHWNTIHAAKKRFTNLFYFSTDQSRRKMIAEIMDYKG